MDKEIDYPHCADRRSYSQHGEDVLIQHLLRDCSSRFIVDVGANDGRSWSNSYLLGQLGYSLLLIEPMPQFAGQCRRLYGGRDDVVVEMAAIGRQRGEATFFIHNDLATDELSMRSSLRKELLPTSNMTEIRVQVHPLADLLKKHRWPPDYALLSIDAEGCDLDVLETAELDRWRPKVICIEEADTQAATVPEYLSQYHYRRHSVRGPNGIYVLDHSLSATLARVRRRVRHLTRPWRR
jgi:FkbM family methyltransferase